MTDKTAMEIENEALARRLMDRIDRDGCVHLSALVEEIALVRGTWGAPKPFSAYDMFLDGYAMPPPEQVLSRPELSVIGESIYTTVTQDWTIICSKTATSGCSKE